MPIPQQNVPYPRPPYPISNSNPHLSSYPISYTNQPSFTPHYPSQTIGHPSSYPAHVPPPMPGTFGNPYSTHPGVGYGSAGHGYYSQPHVLAQPAAQPYIPGQTVIMVPGQQNSGRGFGQMVKEALVFSTINAGVNRVLNPHHHHVYHTRPEGSSSDTKSETHITYNNNYFNSSPSDMNTPVSGSSYASQGNTPGTYPATYANPVNNPVISPGVSTPIVVQNNTNAMYSTTSNNPSAASINNNMNGPPATSPNRDFGNTMNQEASNGTTVYSPQYKISDNDLSVLTEELFAKQEINVSRYLTLYLQQKSLNVTDTATES